MRVDKYLNYLNEKKRAPVSSKQANIRQDIKASRLPPDNNHKLSKLDNHINKIVNHIKTKGNSSKAQRALITAKKKKFKLQRKMSI